MTDFTFLLKYVVTQQQIADLVVTALEGGSDDWLGSCEPCYKFHQDYSEADRYGEDMIPRTFSVDEDDQTYVFNRAGIQRGLHIMSTKYPSNFRDLFDENMDADTADVFMQCALLGDVIYG